jgi:ribosomal protein S27E
MSAPSAPSRSSFVAIYARTDCPECGSAVMIHGLRSELHCRACESTIAVPMTYWSGLFFRLFEAFPNGKRFSLALSTGMLSELPLFARFREEMPSCAACTSPLPVTLPVGPDGHVSCPRCRHPTRAFARPGWIPAQFGDLQQFFEPVEVPVPPSTKTIAFACQECGGRLRLSSDMRRMTDCLYCKTTIFLPAELWHALHPVEKRRAWWVGVAR